MSEQEKDIIVVDDNLVTDDKKEKKDKQKKTTNKKNIFADIIIVICVIMSMIITFSSIYEYHRLNQVMPASSITSLLSIWGGELLIIALRQIFGSDVVAKKNNKINYSSYESSYSIDDSWSRI